MTKSRDPERLLTAYLAVGMEVLPDRVVDALLDEVHRTRQRAVFGPWRTPGMNRMLKMAFAAAAVVVVVVAGINFLPRDGSGVGGSGGVSPSPLVSLSPKPSPSHQAARMTVAGTELNDTSLQLTVELPQGWTSGPYAASNSAGGPPSGIAFFVSLIDNTFTDPCGHVQRNPKIGSTVEARATALGEIPSTTATEPVQTTIAGHEATYIELAIPASLPCEPNQFYLWQDSPMNYWWVAGPNEIVRVWILDAGGQAVAIAARSWPGTSDAAKAELQGILNSIVFDVTSTQPSQTPAAS